MPTTHFHTLGLTRRDVPRAARGRPASSIWMMWERATPRMLAPMLIRRSLFVASLVGASFTLLHCVGDDPAPTSPAPGTDGGTDSTVTTDGPSGEGAPSDAPTETGPTCTIADAGKAGSLDPAFVQGHKQWPGGGTTYDAETLAIDSQGRIYVIGRAQNCVTASSGFDIAVMRLGAGGAIDTSFGGGKGYVCYDTSGSDSVVSAYVDESDRLVFAGHGVNAAIVGRLLATGNLDPAFAGGKIAQVQPDGTNAGWTAYGVSADGNGIVLSGGNVSPFGPSTKAWALRMSNAGLVDTSTFVPYISDKFAGFRAGHQKLDGKLYLPTRSATSNDWTFVILDDKGSAVGAPGLVTPPGATSANVPMGLALARAKGSDDQLLLVGGNGTDPSSGSATWWTKTGATTGPILGLNNSRWDPAYSRTPVARQCDDKVLIALLSLDQQTPTVMRLTGQGATVDTSYGLTGNADIFFDGGLGAGGNYGGLAIATRPDGRGVVVGNTNRLNGAVVYQLLP